MSFNIDESYNLSNRPQNIINGLSALATQFKNFSGVGISSPSQSITQIIKATAPTGWTVKTAPFSALSNTSYYIGGAATIDIPTVATLGDSIKIWVSQGVTLTNVTIACSSTINSVLQESSQMTTRVLTLIYGYSGWETDQPLVVTPIVGNTYYQTLLLDNPWLNFAFQDTNGTAVDSSGNTRNGTYIGGYASVAGINSQKAINLSNGYIQIPYQIYSPKAFTYECRFKCNNSQASLLSFSNTLDTTGWQYTREVYVLNGTLRFYNYNGTNLEGITNVADDDWHILTLSFGDNGIRLWLDNHLEASSSDPNYQPFNGYWLLGWSKTGWGVSPALTLAEASIYNYQLSDAQIIKHHSA